MVLRMIVGLGLTVIAFAIAGRRVWWLKRLAFTGQPAPERLEYAKTHLPGDLRAQLTEVIDERHAALGVLLPPGMHEALADDAGAREGTGTRGHDRGPGAASWAAGPGGKPRRPPRQPAARPKRRR